MVQRFQLPSNSGGFAPPSRRPRANQAERNADGHGPTGGDEQKKCASGRVHGGWFVHENVICFSSDAAPRKDEGIAPRGGGVKGGQLYRDPMIARGLEELV